MKTLEAGKQVAIKNILFATDFSDYSNAALPYAMAIARRFGAKLYGAHVLAAGQYIFMSPESWVAFAEEEAILKQTAIEKLEEQLRGVPHQVLSGVGDVSDVIDRLNGEHDFDLIVLGSHGRTGARKVLMGSIAEAIYRTTDCPVLNVGPNVPRDPSSKIRFQRILFSTDFARDRSAALSYAISLADEEASELLLLHVITPSASGSLSEEGLKASICRRLRELLPAEAEGCDVKCLVEVGKEFAPPAEKILEVVRERQPDLVVLGVRQRNGGVASVTHWAHSTSQHIVAHATCPVLTIRG
jgi:nucleotide-binding universal stress UspA family protein